MGRGAGGTITTYDATQDVDFDHETEYSQSRRLLIATDERGGGVTSPGATCPTTSPRVFERPPRHARPGIGASRGTSSVLRLDSVPYAIPHDGTAAAPRRSGPREPG